MNFRVRYRISCEPYHTAKNRQASTPLLRGIAGLCRLRARWRSLMLLLRRRRSRGGSLLLPLVELLFLLLLLLRTGLAHRRRGPNQRMLLLLRSPHVFLWRLERPWILRLCAPILRLLHVATVLLRHSPRLRRLHIAILRLRASLLLVDSRLRLRNRPHLRIAPVRRTKRFESLLRRLWTSTLIYALIDRCGLRRADWTNQRLVVEMSSSLRLPLFDRSRRRGRRSDGNHRTADDGHWRPYANGRPAPITLARIGSARTMCDIGAVAISRGSTRMMFPATGRAFTNVSCETTVTPLFTRWFT